MIVIKVISWIVIGFLVLWIEDTIIKKKKIQGEFKLIVFRSVYGVLLMLWIQDTFFHNFKYNMLSYITASAITVLVLILMIKSKDLISSILLKKNN